MLRRRTAWWCVFSARGGHGARLEQRCRYVTHVCVCVGFALLLGQVQMSEIDPTVMGGTMRLGATPTLLCGVRDPATGDVKQSLAHVVYSGQASACTRAPRPTPVTLLHTPAG